MCFYKPENILVALLKRSIANKQARTADKVKEIADKQARTADKVNKIADKPVRTAD